MKFSTSTDIAWENDFNLFPFSMQPKRSVFTFETMAYFKSARIRESRKFERKTIYSRCRFLQITSEKEKKKGANLWLLHNSVGCSWFVLTRVLNHAFTRSIIIQVKLIKNNIIIKIYH